MRRLSIVGLAAAVLITVLALGAGRSDVVRANPDTVQAGYDLLETVDPTSLDFLAMPIPADFFGPGSDPFDGIIALEGVPIPDYDPGTGAVDGLGPTSTIVHRSQDAGATGFPDTVPLEIVELSLKSVAPITVTYWGGLDPEQWDVTAEVPENDPNQVPGTITVRHEGANSGTFDALLPVKPILTFTQIDPPNTVVVLDWHTEGLDPLEFVATGEDWCHTANPLHSPAGQWVIEKQALTSNFFPGIDCAVDPYVRDKALFTLDATVAVHSVQPAELPAPYYECFSPIADPGPGVPVTLQTQFGTEEVVVDAAQFLCLPTLMNGEGDLTLSHLKCYDIVGGQDRPHVVNLEHQFGLDEDVEVGAGTSLCVPAVKTPVVPPGPPSGPLLTAPHYECFSIVGNNPAEIVGLENQFRTLPGVDVGLQLFWCAPALKNGEGDLDAPHRKCYATTAPPPGYIVDLETQFGLEEDVEVSAGSRFLCVPAAKTLAAVGGTANFPDDEGAVPGTADAPSGTSFPYAALAGGLTALALVAAGGWYARRRWVR